MNATTKRILLWSILGVTLIGLSSFAVVQARKHSGKKVRIKNKNPKKILIVGDSQSAIKTANGGDITFTYPNLLRKQFSGKSFDVLALQGKTTAWMLSNLPEKLKGKKYDRVYIYGGGNDATNTSITIDKIISNIQRMVNLARENGADVFVNLGYKIEGTNGKFGNYTIMPITPYIKDRTQWIPIVERRKLVQKRLSKEIKGANLIPIYDLKQNTSDGIHPNAQGHKLVAQNYAKTLK
jgi:lysophospholipase L1-like esterase